MKVDEKTYQPLPDHLKRLFIKLPNPGSDEVVKGFPQTTSGGKKITDEANTNGLYRMGFGGQMEHDVEASSGSAARFFYCAKASKAERNMGCEGLAEQEVHRAGHGNKENDDVTARFRTVMKNNHPTVKPLALMRYLCRLITPPDGIVIDPFAGSGSTLIAAKQEGFSYIGIEMEEEYIQIAECRLSAVDSEQQISFV